MKKLYFLFSLLALLSFNIISGLKNGEKIVEAMRSNITGSKISKKGYAKAMEEYGVREVVDTILNKCSSYIFFKTDRRVTYTST